MNLLSITRIIAISGLALGSLGILLRLKDIMNRPFKKDLSRGRGSVEQGILFAFNQGLTSNTPKAMKIPTWKKMPRR